VRQARRIAALPIVNGTSSNPDAERATSEQDWQFVRTSGAPPSSLDQVEDGRSALRASCSRRSCASSAGGETLKSEEFAAALAALTQDAERAFAGSLRKLAAASRPPPVRQAAPTRGRRTRASGLRQAHHRAARRAERAHRRPRRRSPASPVLQPVRGTDVRLHHARRGVTVHAADAPTPSRRCSTRRLSPSVGLGRAVYRCASSRGGQAGAAGAVSGSSPRPGQHRRPSDHDAGALTRSTWRSRPRAARSSWTRCAGSRA